jgi:hypothetical protein
MTVSTRSSLIMLDRCRIYSEHKQNEVCISEPEDYVIEVMGDFADRINPYDSINDTALWELLEVVFNRTKKAEE